LDGQTPQEIANANAFAANLALAVSYFNKMHEVASDIDVEYNAALDHAYQLGGHNYSPFHLYQTEIPYDLGHGAFLSATSKEFTKKPQYNEDHVATTKLASVIKIKSAHNPVEEEDDYV
jgi:hypothetical protein